jgi:hypothetical protein
MRKAGLLLAVLMLLLPPFGAAGCTLLQKGPQSSPEKVAAVYLDAFKSGDFDAMLNLSAPWVGGEAELDFIRQFVGMIELKSYVIGPVELLSDSEALVEVSVTVALLGHEKTETNRIRVIKKDGKWYVAGGLLD